MDLMEMGGQGLDSSGSGLGSVVGSCEHGMEPLDSRKHGKFIE